MVTTLGDLRRDRPARAATMSTETPRKQTPARPTDADPHLPHEVVGLLVAQALDWDTRRIVDAFAIALKQASEQGLRTQIDGSEAEAQLPSEPAGKHTESAPVQERDRLEPNAALHSGQEGARAPTDLDDRVAAQGVLTEQFALAHDGGRTPAIADVRQQFITLGELVLEAIGAVDRSGGEAVS